MKMARRWALATLILSGALTAAAQQDDTYHGDDDYYYGDERSAQQEQSQFLFTPTLVDLVINRITDEMAKHYEFDDAQVWDTREAIKSRISPWLMENRTEIIKLANQYMEGILGDTPPSPDQVADWSARVQPLIQEFGGLVQDSAGEMREFMTEEQRLQLDGEMAAFQVGMDYMNSRLDHWRDGGYDPQTEWPRSEGFHQAERERVQRLEQAQQQAREIEMGLAPQGPDNEALIRELNEEAIKNNPEKAAEAARRGPEDEWEAYVNAFIRRYQLTEAQRNSARKLLRTMQERRDGYLTRKAGVIDKIYAEMQKIKDEEDRTRLREKYREITEPIDRYFGLLKDKLERIPTSAQRRQAAMDNMRSATPRAKLEAIEGNAAVPPPEEEDAPQTP